MQTQNLNLIQYEAYKREPKQEHLVIWHGGTYI